MFLKTEVVLTHCHQLFILCLVSVFQDFGSDDDRKNNQRYDLSVFKHPSVKQDCFWTDLYHVTGCAPGM